MPLTDEELFDFDRKRLGSYNKKWTDEVFAEMPDLYRNHLTIAKWIDGWRERMRDGGPGDLRSEEFRKGSAFALREIAAHLRQADFVPGGALYEDLVPKKACLAVSPTISPSRREAGSTRRHERH
jgi:hypothetical protein